MVKNCEKTGKKFRKIPKKNYSNLMEKNFEEKAKMVKNWKKKKKNEEKFRKRAKKLRKIKTNRWTKILKKKPEKNGEIFQQQI